MTKVIDQYLGVLRGAMGPQVFKSKSGKSYAAKLPHMSLVPPSAETLKRRTKFKLTLKMAKRMHDIPQLKYFWKNYVIEDETKKLSASNKMVKSIYPRMTETGPMNTIRIVPDKGFEVTATSTTLTNSKFTVVLQAIGNTKILNPAVDINVRLVCVAHLSGPENPDDRANVFFSLVSESSTLNTMTPLTIEIEVDDYNKQIYDDYTEHKVFFALVTTDADDVPANFSNTFPSS